MVECYIMKILLAVLAVVVLLGSGTASFDSVQADDRKGRTNKYEYTPYEYGPNTFNPRYP